MPSSSTKQKQPNSTFSPPTIYVVLQRTSSYLPRRDEHNVSCVSAHTSKAAANWAAEEFFDIDTEDEMIDRETGWYDWEDLCGTRVQTNSEGLLRIIMTEDTQEESLVWVEKKIVTINEEEEESGDVNEEGGTDLNNKRKPSKRTKFSEIIDLSRD